MTDKTLKQVTNEETETDKFFRVKDEAQAIGRFLHWMHVERGWDVAEWNTEGDLAVVPLKNRGDRVEALLAEYFDIDLDKLDREKLALIERIRAENAARTKGET